MTDTKKPTKTTTRSRRKPSEGSLTKKPSIKTPTTKKPSTGLKTDSKYFTYKELECKCNYDDCDHFIEVEEFIKMLNLLREDMGVPLKVNSCYRCSKHNADVGGVPTSYHTKGIAVDIARTGWDLGEFITKAKARGFTGIGIYSGFVHIDRRLKPAQWRG